jgi:hypothetical protein
MLILLNFNAFSVIGHENDEAAEIEHDETIERNVPLESIIIPVILLGLGLFTAWKYFPKRTTKLM